MSFKKTIDEYFEPLQVRCIGKRLGYLIKRSELWTVYINDQEIFHSFDKNATKQILKSENLKNLIIHDIKTEISENGCDILYKIYC